MSLRNSMLWVLPAMVIVLSGMAFAGLNDGLVAYYPFEGT
jgi:cytochrome c-type biogenesis protein CcmH/NrfF